MLQLCKNLEKQLLPLLRLLLLEQLVQQHRHLLPLGCNWSQVRGHLEISQLLRLQAQCPPRRGRSCGCRLCACQKHTGSLQPQLRWLRGLLLLLLLMLLRLRQRC
jgi:hypothetical protein